MYRLNQKAQCCRRAQLTPCREHHQQMHRHGNEAAWWAKVQIAPIEAAKQLWEASLLQEHCSAPHGQSGSRDPEIGAAK
jgi:hypothetical protein